MTGPTVRIGLLGPVEVRRDDAIVDVSGRLAVLLATLAINSGRVVSYVALTEYLWPEELPQNYRRTIQTYAGRLRSMLGSEAVVSRPEGLRLDLDPECVDVFRFRRLVAQGRGAAPAEELDLINEARALWRGDPLTGLWPDVLERENAPALIEELLGVTERAHELRLRIDGGDEAMLAALRRLVAQYPWRERSWGHLMVALYRQGRKGEALAAFHQLGGVLRDDLGIEPGVEVARLYQQILVADPVLMGRAIDPVVGMAPGEEPDLRDASPALPSPEQLPSGTPDFVGRRDELDELRELLTRTAERARVCVISGPAGVGKTSLALEAAHVTRADFPDGQLFRQLSGPGWAISGYDVLGAFLQDLGVAADAVPLEEGERSALFRSLCAKRRLLIVLDNVRSADEVSCLIPGAGASAVLVTCRRRTSLPANLRIDLGAMSAAESHELLAAIVEPSRLAAEPEATGAVVAACGGSSLALRIVAGRLANRPSWSIGHLAERLTGPGRLDELQLENTSVRAALDAAVDGLDPVVAARFRRLSAVPSATTDNDMAAAVWGVDAVEAQRTLDELCDSRLLEPAAPDLFEWHDLVHDYLDTAAGPDVAGHSERLLHYVIRSLLNAKDEIRPDDRPPPPVIASIIDVDGRAFHGRRDVHAWLHPRWTLLVAVARHALASGDKQAMLEAAAFTVLLDNVTSECCQRGNDNDALLRSLVHAELPAEGRHFVAAAWHNLATIYWNRDRFAEAIDASEHAIDSWRRLGDRYGEAIMLNNLPSGHMRQRDYQAALMLLQQCVDAGEVIPPMLRIRCMLNLAETYVCLDDQESAQRWVAASRALGDLDEPSFGAYRERVVVAQLRRLQGDGTAALEAAEQAVVIARVMQSTSLEAQALVLLARTRRLFGLASEDAAAEAVRTALGHDHLVVHAEALVELGHAHYSLGDPRNAEACWREAEREFAALGTSESAAVKMTLAELPSQRSPGMP